MGFGKMLSGLFKKDDEQEAVSDTNETKDAGSVESRADMKDLPSPDTSASQTAPSDNAKETNAPAAEAGAARSADGNSEVTQDKVLEALSQVYDPEIPIDIVNLGLIYGVDIEDGKVMIRMTMTAPGCPASTQIAGESKILVEELPGVQSCDIELVWDPPWDPSKMSEEAQQSLGMF